MKLLRFLAPFRATVAIVLALAFAQAVASLYLPRLMADIVDEGIARNDTRAIISIGGLMLLVAIVSTACAIACSYFAAKAATGFGRLVRGRVFSQVTQLSVHQFTKFGTASLITPTTNDTTQVQQVLIMVLTIVVTAPMTFQWIQIVAAGNRSMPPM